MKDLIFGVEFKKGARIVFMKPTKEGYEITQKGVPGVCKIPKDNIDSVLFAHCFKKVSHP